MPYQSDLTNPLSESHRLDPKQSHKTPKELEGRFGPRPIDMTVDDLIREATSIGMQRRWERYLAQLAKEEAAREG